jgi:hypothetical protein
MTGVIQVIVDVLALSWLTIGAAHVVGSSIYDIRQARRKKWTRDHPHAGTAEPGPLVSVIMAASQANADSIKKSVRAVLGSRYRRLELIIVNDPKVIDQTVIDGCTGGFIILLTPDHLVDKNAIRNAVDRLSLDERAEGAGLNLGIRPDHRLLGLLDLFNKLSREQINKLYDVIGRQKGLSEAVLYRREALLSNFDHSRKRRFRYIFVSDARIRVESPASATTAIRRFYSAQLIKAPYIPAYPMVLKFALPSMFTFFMYEAVYLQNTFLLGLGWATFSAYLIFAVLSDENLKFRQKLGICLIAPAMFGPFIVLTLLIATASLELFLTALGENAASIYRFIQPKIKPTHLLRRV